MIRTYSELSKFHTFTERFKYLQLKGEVGKELWGYDRYLNQRFYHSREWRSIRDQVIIRDKGCDLGIEGFEILKGRTLIHHMNPIRQEDIENGDFANLLNPEFLITTTHNTHQAITYGDESLLITAPTERKPNDTCPWKKGGTSMTSGTLVGSGIIEVYEAPSDSSPIVCRLECLSKVTVNVRKSTSEWYKIYAEHGDGFVRRENVAIPEHIVGED